MGPRNTKAKTKARNKEVSMFMKAAIMRLGSILGLNKVLALVLPYLQRTPVLPRPPPLIPLSQPSSSAPPPADDVAAELKAAQLSKMQTELGELRAKIAAKTKPPTPPPLTPPSEPSSWAPPPADDVASEIAEVKAWLSKVQTEVDELRAGKNKKSLPVRAARRFQVSDVSSGPPLEEAKRFLSLIGSCSKGKVLAMGRLRDFFPSSVEANPLVMLVVGNTSQTTWKDLEPVTVSIAGYTLQCEVVSSVRVGRTWSACIVESVGDETFCSVPYATICSGAITGSMIILHDESHAISFTVKGFDAEEAENLPVPGAQPGDLVLQVTPKFITLEAVVAEASPESCRLLYPCVDYYNLGASEEFYAKHPERRVTSQNIPPWGCHERHTPAKLPTSLRLELGSRFRETGAIVYRGRG